MANQINSRIIHKHDTEANWNKATSFIPKQGEIIIYDIDSNYTYERFKIGDGKTAAPSLPFATKNAFSNVVIGSTTIAADTKTDTLTFVAGSNITLTPDATKDQITISATDTKLALDTALTATGKAADAKAAGDRIKNLEDQVSRITSLENQVTGIKKVVDIAVEDPTDETINSISEILGYIEDNEEAISILTNKQDKINGAASTITSSDLTKSRALISNASGKVAVSAVTSTELGYLDGVTSSIQSQLDDKLDTAGLIVTTDGSGNAITSASYDSSTKTITLTKGATYNNYTYTLPVAGSALGGIKSGGDITVGTDGTVSIVDDSHNHVISNVDGLQSAIDGKAPTSHASSSTTYGAASASNYGHAKASGTTPKANGTAAVGSETSSFARGDHVHPLQTSVSGSAGSLATTRYIDGVSFNGSANVTRYATCSTAAATAAKTASITEGTFSLVTGARVTVKFTYANSVANPTLNIGSTGAKAIYWHGAALASSQYWQAGAVLDFVYNGTQWDLIGIAKDNNSTYTVNNATITISPGTGLKTGGSFTTNQSSAGTITIDHSNSITAGTASGSATKTLTFGDTFTIPTVTYDAQGHITGKGTTTLTMPANPNTNTTYTLSGKASGNTWITTLTPSSGSATTSTVPAMGAATSSAAGTAGLVPAPAAGKQTSFLRGDGTWVVPTNTNTKVNVTLGTTTKAYLLGTSTTPTSTATGVTAIADIGVYLDTTAGCLTATSFKGSGASLSDLNAGNISSGTLPVARLATSGVTAGTYGPSAAVTGTEGATINVPQITVDAYGRVTSVTNRVYTSKNSTYTIPTSLKNPYALSFVADNNPIISYNGAAAIDFAINAGTNITFDISEENAVTINNTYTLPTASSTLGGVKTTSTVTSTSGLTACPIISGVPYYKNTDTHHTAYLYLGASGASANATSAVSNPYINLRENSTNRSSLQIKGGTNVTVSGNNGIITISSTDSDTTYSAGTGLSLSGTTFNHSNSITAGSVGSAQSPSHGGTFAIPKITYDAQGHITGATTVNITLPGDSNTDTKVTQTATEPTSAATWYLLGGNSASTDTTTTLKNSSLKVQVLQGTASAEGYVALTLGNGTASGTAGNKRGQISIYSSGAGYHTIKGATSSSNFTHTLPAATGTFLNTGNYTSYTVAKTGGTMTGRLEMIPTGSSAEGGEILLGASQSATTKAGIVLDNYESTLRVFGQASSDGATVTGTGTPLIINPYAKTITGGYTITGTLSGNATSATTASTCTGNSATANKVNNNLVIKLNSGTTEGTNLFTFNGSAAKTIDITPSAIGAVKQMPYNTALNANTLYDTGIYMGSGLSNGPTSYTFGQLLTLSYRKPTGNMTPDHAGQIYLHGGNEGHTMMNTLCYRTSNATAWNAWQMTAHGAASTAVGSTTAPVYMDSVGTIKPITSVAVSKGGTGATSAANARNNLLVNSANSITLTANDTNTTWSALGGISLSYFNLSNCLIDQPTQYGYILSMATSTSTTMVAQLWHDMGGTATSQNNGNLYHRFSNGNGWIGSWRKVLDEVNYSSIITLTDLDGVSYTTVSDLNSLL